MMTQVIEVEEEVEETGNIIQRLKGRKLSRDLKHNETAKWHKTSKLWLMRHTRWLEDALQKKAARQGHSAHCGQTAQLAPGSSSHARQR